MDNHYLKQIEDINKDAVILDGFDDCIVGIARTFAGYVLVYSESSIVEKLMEDMTQEEAWEYYDFNIAGGYLGEFTPVFLVEI